MCGLGGVFIKDDLESLFYWQGARLDQWAKSQCKPFAMHLKFRDLSPTV